MITTNGILRNIKWNTITSFMFWNIGIYYMELAGILEATNRSRSENNIYHKSIENKSRGFTYAGIYKKR